MKRYLVDVEDGLRLSTSSVDVEEEKDDAQQEESEWKQGEFVIAKEAIESDTAWSARRLFKAVLCVKSLFEMHKTDFDDTYKNSLTKGIIQ